MKRTFVVPDEKEGVYEKFKELVPEVSSMLMEFIEGYVNKHEAIQAGMIEQTIYEGLEISHVNVFQGKTLKFYGVKLTGRKHDGADDVYIEVFLTLKGKFLVTLCKATINNAESEHTYKVYETYSDMLKKTGLDNAMVKDCEAYLNKYSTIRTYEILDV